MEIEPKSETQTQKTEPESQPQQPPPTTNTNQPTSIAPTTNATLIPTLPAPVKSTELPTTANVVPTPITQIQPQTQIPQTMIAANPNVNANGYYLEHGQPRTVSAQRHDPLTRTQMASIQQPQQTTAMENAFALQVSAAMQAAQLQSMALLHGSRAAVAQQRINKYACWPPIDSQQYLSYHPLGWPIDSDYQYQISNYLAPQSAFAAASLVRQQQQAQLANVMALHNHRTVAQHAQSAAHQQQLNIANNAANINNNAIAMANANNANVNRMMNAVASNTTGVGNTIGGGGNMIGGGASGNNNNNNETKKIDVKVNDGTNAGDGSNANDKGGKEFEGNTIEKSEIETEIGNNDNSNNENANVNNVNMNAINAGTQLPYLMGGMGGLNTINPLLLSANLMSAAAISNLAATGAASPGKQFSLFVFHLPEDIDDHGLLQLFAPYGAIRSNVMRHDTGRSRGFGFVHFNTRHEAQIAIDMMNGHQIGRKRLRVSFKREEPHDRMQRINGVDQGSNGGVNQGSINGANGQMSNENIQNAIDNNNL